MLRLDKIKIISSIDNIKILEEDKFENRVKDGCVVKQQYTMMSPYYLYIEADYQDRELVLEFTGKILRDDYHNLINKDTIHSCLSNISDLGLCELNTDKILTDGEVVKIDVCQDVECLDCKSLTETIRAGVSNFKKYLVRNIGDNLIIEKNVKTKGYKRRLIIYNKEKELRMAGNNGFISSLNNPQVVLDYYKGKIRFELNLNSKEQIRRSLNIVDTSIQSIFDSISTPIWDFLDVAVTDGDVEANCKSLAELKDQLLLEYCSNDLVKVEALLRKYYSRNTHISQVMKPYRALVAKLAENLTPNIKQQLRNLLLEITILIGIFV